MKKMTTGVTEIDESIKECIKSFDAYVIEKVKEKLNTEETDTNKLAKMLREVGLFVNYKVVHQDLVKHDNFSFSSTITYDIEFVEIPMLEVYK